MPVTTMTFPPVLGAASGRSRFRSLFRERHVPTLRLLPYSHGTREDRPERRLLHIRGDTSAALAIRTRRRQSDDMKPMSARRRAEALLLHVAPSAPPPSGTTALAVLPTPTAADWPSPSCR
jgi:hypothetical protein